MRRRPLALLVGVTVSVGGCSQLPLESEYSNQRDICSSEQAELFAELVEDCRARWEDDRSCAGVLGFTGSIEGVDVVVESDLLDSEFDEQGPPGGVVAREGVSMLGSSPYFRFSLSLKHIGGPVSDDPLDRTLMVPGPDGVYDDDLASAAIRLSTGAESNDRNSFDGELSISLQSEFEEIGRFRLNLGGEDEIEGCFHAFATTFQHEEAPSDP